MIHHPKGEISPTALRKLRAYVRELWREYAELRTAALAARRAERAARGTGLDRWEPAYLAVGRALDAVVESRRWAWDYQRRLERAEALPVVPHGGRVSPNALARLRANGRLK